MDTLPNGFNWKPYWGNSTTAIPGQFDHELIKIVHFHGPKLSTASCFFNELDNDSKSGTVSACIDRIRRCGLKDAPNKEAEWLQGLADILSMAYTQDGGYFYREMLRQVNIYLDSANGS